MNHNVDTTKKLKLHTGDMKNEHGLKNLVAYYKKMFDRRENLDHYGPDDYKNARRCFVKYALKNRKIIERRP